MEKGDIQLIERYSTNDRVLKRLYDEHINFEQRLDKLGRKPFLTTREEAERKELQKQKLRGRDEIQRILNQYRTQTR